MVKKLGSCPSSSNIENIDHDTGVSNNNDVEDEIGSGRRTNWQLGRLRSLIESQIGNVVRL